MCVRYVHLFSIRVYSDKSCGSWYCFWYLLLMAGIQITQNGMHMACISGFGRVPGSLWWTTDLFVFAWPSNYVHTFTRHWKRLGIVFIPVRTVRLNQRYGHGPRSVYCKVLLDLCVWLCVFDCTPVWRICCMISCLAKSRADVTGLDWNLEWECWWTTIC
jgi:hypothetical protein